MSLSESATRLLWRDMHYTLSRRTILDFISAAEACFISWEIITVKQFNSANLELHILIINLTLLIVAGCMHENI